MNSSRAWIGRLSAIILVLTVAHDAQADQKSNRARAVELFRDGNDRAALPLIDAELKRHPRDLELRIKRAAILVRANQPLQALEETDRVLSYDRGLPGAHSNRGIALAMLHREYEALEEFQAALTIYAYGAPAPNSGPPPSGVLSTDQPSTWGSYVFTQPYSREGIAVAFDGSGQMHATLGRPDLAARDFTNALSIKPDDSHAYNGRGMAKAALGRFDEALADFNRSLELNPQNPKAYQGRGAALADQGRLDEALTDFNKALELDPNEVKNLRLRGCLNAKLGRNEDALRDFDSWIRLKKDDPEAHKNRGGVLVRMGRPSEALASLEEAIRLDPKRASSYLNRAAARQALGDPDKALDDCEKAVEFGCRRSGLYALKGSIERELGLNEAALSDLDMALKLDPNDVSSLCNRGAARVEVGLMEDAADDYRNAIAIDPKSVAAIVGLGEALRKQGKNVEALAEFERALQLTPKNALLYVLRGHLHRAEGRLDAAILDYGEALKLDPRLADVYATRGWTFLAAGLPGGDVDARAYLDLRGGNDPNAPYMALLGALAARKAGRELEARVFLAEATANTDPAAWPSPAIDYFRGLAPAANMLNEAKTYDKKLEARLLLAFDFLARGRRAQAIEELVQVRDHAANGTIIGDLARALIARLESADDASKTSHVLIRRQSD